MRWGFDASFVLRIAMLLRGLLTHKRPRIRNFCHFLTISFTLDPHDALKMSNM